MPHCYNILSMKENEFRERRNHFRMTMNAELNYSIRGKKTTYKGTCKDMSHSGIKLETKKALTIGTVLNVEIDLGNKKFKPVKAELEVIRIEKAKSNHFAVAGKILYLE